MTDTPQIHLARGNHGCRLAGDRRAVAIVIDALRASTTIAALLSRGVARILVVARVEDAQALAATTPGALLVGERGGERLPGFDLGNSPLEVLAVPELAGRTAVFTSSNGAQRLTACLDADCTLVGTVANAGAITAWVRRYAERESRDVVMIAAGLYPDETFISPEDEAAGAYLATRLGLPIAPDARDHFRVWQRDLILHGLEGIFRASRHAQRLMEIGYGDDVLYCARPDTAATVPIVTGPVLLAGKRVGVEVEALT